MASYGKGMMGGVVAAGLLFAAPGVSEAAFIYQDSFNREAFLNNAAPDIAPGGETWTALEEAGPAPATDGEVLSFGASRRNMYLPFEPGEAVYELSVDVRTHGVDDSSEWHGLGFMGQDPRLEEGNMAFGGDPEGGRPWMLLRNNGAAVTFAGPGGDNNLGGPGEGTFDPDVFHTLRLVLDTTAEQWTVDYFINDTQIGDTFTYSENPDIGSVGLSASGGSGFVFTYDNFELIPEPASLALMGLGGLLLLRRSRQAEA